MKLVKDSYNCTLMWYEVARKQGIFLPILNQFFVTRKTILYSFQNKITHIFGIFGQKLVYFELMKI